MPLAAYSCPEQKPVGWFLIFQICFMVQHPILGLPSLCTIPKYHIQSYIMYHLHSYNVQCLSLYLYIYIIIAEFPHQLPSVFSCFTLPSPSVRASHVAGGRCEIWRCVTKARLKMSAGPGGQLWGDHTGDASHGVSTR